MPEHELEGHVVIVTGATRGIGRALTRTLAGAGARVVATGRKPDLVAETAAELEGLGADHLAVVGDVADRDGAFALVEQAVGRWGRVDGLVANAQSLRRITPLEDVSPSDMELLLGTGPEGTLWSMQAAFPVMRDQGRGRIVTMGSAMGMTGAPGYGPYSAAKEAIRSLTRTAAREWGRHGITVNCVCPASVGHRAPPTDDVTRAAAFAEMYKDNPIGRDGDAELDIAPAVHFLLSDAAQYVTGQTLMVDGGGVMRA